MSQEDQIKFLQDEISFVKQKLEADKKAQEESKNKKISFDPVLATIAVALIGFIGTPIGTLINNVNATKLETRKFEFDIIKKGLEQPKEERIKYLAFLSSVGLIKERDIRTALDSLVRNPNSIPYLSAIDNTLQTTVKELAVKRSSDSDTAVIELEFVNADNNNVTVLAPWFQLADTTNTYNGAWGGMIDNTNDILFPFSLKPLEKKSVVIKLSANTLTLNPGKYLAFEYFYIDGQGKNHDVWGDFNINIVAHGNKIERIEKILVVSTHSGN